MTVACQMDAVVLECYQRIDSLIGSIRTVNFQRDGKQSYGKASRSLDAEKNSFLVRWTFNFFFEERNRRRK